MENSKDIFLKKVLSFEAKRSWEEIIIHCSASKDTNLENWESLKRYHINDRKWSDIGYHFGIEKIENEYLYLLGRDLNTMGAHCFGQNRNSIGICLVGNYDNNSPSKEQYIILARLCKTLMRKYTISLLNIKPHWVYNIHKTCPGRLFNFNDFRKQIQLC